MTRQITRAAYGDLCILMGEALELARPEIQEIGSTVGSSVAVFMLLHREADLGFVVDYVGSTVRYTSDASDGIRSQVRGSSNQELFTHQLIIPLSRDTAPGRVRTLENKVSNVLDVPVWRRKFRDSPQPETTELQDAICSSPIHSPTATQEIATTEPISTATGFAVPDQHDFDVFMSYNAKDKPLVMQVHDALRKCGINTWLDDDRIRPGTPVLDELQSGIKRSRTAAVFFGPHGMGKWQHAEIRAITARCVDLEMTAIPILLPCQRSLPPDQSFLQTLNLVRFDVSMQEPAPMRRLLWGITGKVSIAVDGE